MADLLRQAEQKRVPTFVDVLWDSTGGWMHTLRPCLPYVDYFVPNLPEAQQLTGERDPEAAAAHLLRRGVGTVVVKMGAKGCLLQSSNGHPVWLPAFGVEVVDATGAGDAFRVGFIAGVVRGWSLERSAELANAVGALCVTGLGATGGVRAFDDTLQFMSA